MKKDELSCKTWLNFHPNVWQLIPTGRDQQFIFNSKTQDFINKIVQNLLHLTSGGWPLLPSQGTRISTRHPLFYTNYNPMVEQVNEDTASFKGTN